MHSQRANLQLLPLATIKPTTFTEHVDATFNPHYEKQFATIDRKGYWKTWDLEGNWDPFRKGAGLTLANTATGRVTVREEGVGDDWGRILWGSDVNTIWTCDRHRAAMYDIRVCSMFGHQLERSLMEYRRTLLQESISNSQPTAIGAGWSTSNAHQAVELATKPSFFRHHI